MRQFRRPPRPRELRRLSLPPNIGACIGPWCLVRQCGSECTCYRNVGSMSRGVWF
jgi:hypothetical protein